MSNAFIGVERDPKGDPAAALMVWVGLATVSGWKFSMSTGMGIDGIGTFQLHERDAKIRELEAKGFLDVEKHSDAEISEKLGLPPDQVAGARAEVLKYAEHCKKSERQTIEEACALL